MSSGTTGTTTDFTTELVNLDGIKDIFSKAANDASKDVKAKIDALKTKPDDPAALAELQHSINKWSVTFNLSATTTRAIKDVMQSILQKI
ncbi:type III secretion system needle filament subunit SctF [Vibrio caribbeanicus]|uniref:type III secretion system needle filament subunit SctF n=1 Tax=Vibrio caribbeanicus TaxID=701175 RepID=UPI0030DA755E